MSNRAAAITGSVVAAVLAVIVLVARRARTEHPPVASAVPRVDDFR